MHIKLPTAVALVVSLILAGCVVAPHRNSNGEFPVCHTAAVNWPTNLTLEQLKDEPIKQLEGGITMSKEGVANTTNVVTWREFQRLSKAGYAPAANCDLGMAGWFHLERGVIPFWEHAIPARHSFVRPLPMNRNLLPLLPLDLGPQISGEEVASASAAVKAGQSWLEFYPDTKIIKRPPECVHLAVDGFIVGLTVMAYGDFDHDGYDDALVLVSHSAIGGTLSYSFNAILTRTNASDCLRLVHE